VSQRRVLVVDDEPTIRAALVRFFTRQGFAVEEAGDGRQALDRLLGEGPEPDVIVCDFRMPEVSGAQVYATVEMEKPDLIRRFIFSSGDVISGEHQQFLERAVCPVLQKPFELARLREAVDRIVPPS
jgi:two-component system, cell cycle sensor histidine kinase and response regulator CckA